MKTRKKGTVLIWTGLLLLATALVLLIYNIAAAYLASVKSDRVADTLISEISVTEEVSAAEEASEETADTLREMPTLTVDGDNYIGYIKIPDLGLSLPVMESWSYANLKKTPCRYSGTVYQDNLVVAAHNYRSHFGKIKSLAIGSEVTFTDTEGHVYRYEVSSVETMQPGQVDDVVSAWGCLTLFTCTPGGQYRVIVRCDRVYSS